MKSLQKNDELNLTAQPQNSLLYVLVCTCLFFPSRASARSRKACKFRMP